MISLATITTFWPMIRMAVFGLGMLSLAATYYAFDKRGTEIAELRIENASLKKDVKIEKGNVTLRETALEEISKQLKAQDADLDKLCSIWSKLHEENSNGDPVGSVLDSVQ